MKIFDISTDILKAEVYPGDSLPSIKVVNSIKNGDDYNLSDITMCLHTGAHIDAPFHFLQNGKTVEELPLEKFVGSCVVRTANSTIDSKWVNNNLPLNCKRLLIKSDGKEHLTEDAVFELCRNNIELVGIDSLSVASEENEVSIHRKLMKNNIVILEGIDLSEINDGEYFLVATPIKIGGAEAAPCRAFLVKGVIVTDE